MNDEAWGRSTKGRWEHLHFDQANMTMNVAAIHCMGQRDWILFINQRYIGTFDTWEEARDATPMMLSLHGYKDES